MSENPAKARCLLVIPAFREGKRLPPYLAKLIQALDCASASCDVLVVDDGSGDGEAELLHKLAEHLRGDHPRLLPPLCLPKNKGKGHAVRTGLDQAQGYAWLGFVDADGAIPASEVCRLLALSSEDGSPPRALFGSRVKMLGRTIDRRLTRHLSGRVFASLVGWLLTPEVYDSQCGLKLVPAEAYQRIRPSLKEDGFCFDVEWLAALIDEGVRVEEVPIDWSDQPGSKVSLVRDAWSMFVALRRIQTRRKQRQQIE